MLALLHARKPAPPLAARGMWLRLHGGADAFGNALGNTVAGAIARKERGWLDDHQAPVIAVEEISQASTESAGESPGLIKNEEQASGIGLWNSDQARELGLTTSDAGDGSYDYADGRLLAANGSATRMIRMPYGRAYTAARFLEDVKGVGNSLIHTAEEGLKAYFVGMASNPQLSIASVVAPSSADTQESLIWGAQAFSLPRFGYDLNEPSGPAMELVTDVLQTGLAVNGLIRGSITLASALKVDILNARVAKGYDKFLENSVGYRAYDNFLISAPDELLKPGAMFAKVGKSVVYSQNYSSLYHGATNETLGLPSGLSSMDAAQEIYKNGLPARGGNIDLIEHVLGSKDSAYRGTTLSPFSQERNAGAGLWADEGGLVIEVKNIRGYDVNAELAGRVRQPDGSFGGNPKFGEQEIAIPAQVKTENISRVGVVSKSPSGRNVIVWLPKH